MRVLMDKTTRVVEGIEGDGREQDSRYQVVEVPDDVMYRPGRKVVAPDGSVLVEASVRAPRTPVEQLLDRLAALEARVATLEARRS